jgi:Spy/CpxP family protein refolding chaperone
MRLKVIAAVALVFASGIAIAAGSPYVAEARAEIKALTAEEVAQLLDGKGMGFAKAAELNGYPGPSHVLELALPLGLTALQREKTQAVFDAMQSAARREGAALVAAERELDRLFAAHTIDAPALEAALSVIEGHRAKLRAIHLEAHLQQAQLLDAAQIARYAELRGYGSGDAHGGHAHH